jgi:hypothetical protein
MTLDPRRRTEAYERLHYGYSGTNLRLRLRNAGVSEQQADAISGAFEGLSKQIAALSNQVRNVIIGQRIQNWATNSNGATFGCGGSDFGAIHRRMGRHGELGPHAE